MKTYIFILIALLTINNSYSADYYWSANSGNNWNTTANWVDGGGFPIGSTPGSSDIVHFTNSNNGNCTIDVNVDIGGLIIDGYTGIIDINGYTFQVSSGNCTFNTGTLNGGTLTINTSGIATFAGTTFGAIVDSKSAELHVSNTVFNSVTTLEKIGASNDYCDGGNTFGANTIIINSGSGYLRMQRGSPDTFNANVDVTNSGSSYILFAYNSAGNTISGNYTSTNSGDGDTYIETGYTSSATLDISGNCTVNNTGTGTQSRNYFALSGTTTIGGNLITNNNSNATRAFIYVSFYSAATLTINGSSTITNNGGATYSNTYIGYNGDITFNGTVSATNSGSATTSRIYFNYDDNCINNFNENIILESTNVNSDGISFGESNGSAILATNKTVTIGAGGYIAGELEFRNFTQTGATAQSLTCTGTARIYNYDSNWGGNINFVAPRINTRGTTYNGTAYLEKTGTSDDASSGNNTFKGNTTLKNSGSRYFYMGNGNPDDFQADLLLENTGAHNMYIAYNSAGNTIGGNLTINQSGTASTYIAVSRTATSSINITGNATLNNTGSGTISQIYLCTNGNVTVGGNLNITNNGTANTSQVLLSNNSDGLLTITGNTVIQNSGSTTTDRIYVGNQGDITFNGTLTIKNNSSATNSEVFCNYNANSNNTYNENIIVESTDASCDGIRFGQANGYGTLAATKTITIGSGGYIAGDLEFRNFTQTGATAQNLTCTGTARINNYDSNWGGNINFVAPRQIVRGTIFNGTSYIEKTGAENDSWAGGNTYVGNSIIKNNGSGYIAVANGTADNFNADATITNNGTSRMYFAWNGAGNTVGGDLILTNSGNGTYINVCTNAATTLDISGNTTITNNSTSDAAFISFGDNGVITCSGNLNITNNGAGTTKSIYIGNRGNITINGNLSITNNSSATNSSVYCGYNSNSTNTYNGNIVVESTDANCDGIRFGQNGGVGTLADTKTVTIGANGFIAGDLEFRNFTQVGNTAQNLTCTGTARIYNYGSNWGGNINFIAPRINTRETVYNGTAYLEKTGAGDDPSSGGNIFEQNVELKNTSVNYFLMGNGIADTCRANLTLNNEGTYRMYFAHHSADNYIAGNLTVNNTTSGNNAFVTFTAHATSSLTVDGTITLNNNSTATTGYISFGDHGNTTCNGNVTVSNNGANTTKQVILGNYGNITFNGTLTLTNNSSANNSQIYLNRRTGYSNTYNENIIVECTDANCDGIRFGESGGSGTLAATKTITIGAGGFIAGDLEFRNFTQIGNTAQNLTCTGTARIYNYDSNWGGDVRFIAPRNLTRGTTYNRTAYIEKTGDGNDASQGGNTFKMDVDFVNSGNGYFMLGNGTFDDYQANVSLLNTGGNVLYFARSGAGHTIAGNFNVNNNSTETNGYIYVCDQSSSNLVVNGNTTITNNGGNTTKRIYIGINGDITFNGTLKVTNNSSATNSQIYLNSNSNSSNTYNENIILESTDASCDGILFGSSNGNGILAAGKTVTIGAGGYIAGYLYFRNFTQTGNTSQTLHPTGTTLLYNYDSNWGGDVSFVSPQIITRGTTYNRTALLEKNGDTNNASEGGNIFVGDAILRNSSTRYFLMGNHNPDVFQADLLLENTSSYYLYLAYNSAGNTIAGDLTINNAGTTGSCITNIARYSSSTLDISGNCTINNTSSSTTSNIDFAYNGDINISGNLDITNNLTADNANITLARNTDSQIIIDGTTTISNDGAGTTKRVYVGYNGDITFNGTLTLTNNSSATNSQIYLNQEDNGLNAYNENIVVECTDANCDGILFGNGNGFGTLANTKTITIGAGGYIAGYLYFKNFTQTGNTAQTLHPTGTTYLYNYNSEWNGNVDFVSPRIYNRQTTYNGTAYIEKNGSVNDDSYGGNTYNDVATLVNSSSSRIRFGRNIANDYNANVTYKKTGSGGLYPTIQSASTYAADININSNSDLTFGSWSNGRVIFDGTTAQSINNLGAAHTFVFRDIQTNNPNDEITLNTPIEISTELDLDAGNIITTSTNLLYMRNNSIVSSVSNDAYIDGPIEKIGDDAFTFPVGNDGFYAPISMSAPNSTNRRFRAQYFHQDADNAGDRTQLAPTLNHISYEEYWTLDRTGAASNVTITLSWDNARSGGVDNLSTLRIAHWNGSIWGDEGNGGTTGDVAAGTIVSSSTISSFSPFTLASTRVENPLPVTLLSFKGEKLEKSSLLKWETKTEINNDYYQLEKSNDGINYSYLAQVSGAGNSNIELEYSYIDENPYNGDNYYRLKQVDFDGTFKYYSPIVINFNTLGVDEDINLYPNPVVNNQNLIISYNSINNNSIIKIIDIKGSEINVNYTITEDKISISTTNLDKGTYFAILNTNGEAINKMFVVE